MTMPRRCGVCERLGLAGLDPDGHVWRLDDDGVPYCDDEVRCISRALWGERRGQRRRA